MSASLALNKRGIYEDREARKLEVDHVPFYYHVVLSMPCNQRCIMCVPNFQHRRDVLPFEDFVALFDQFKEHAEHITLIGGETLMYPWLNEVLELLAEHEIAVTLHTNAFMLNDRVIPALLGLHELHLKCSIDAATRDTYRRIHGRDHFDRVTSNMTRFAELKREHSRVYMITHYVVMRENLDEVLPFIEFAKTLDPARIEFDPVRQVETWHVENGSGWTFDGAEQSCESFPDEFNDTMARAAEACEREGIRHDVHYL
jgi:sulfatase maturation enzyme AslB (radical SAM superfamily)